MALPDRDLQAAIAATRFGLGARPGEIAAARSDPQGFLADQIRPEGAEPALPEPDLTVARADQLKTFFDSRSAFVKIKAEVGGKPAEAASDRKAEIAKAIRAASAGDFLAFARHGATTPAGFRERWALFWANHFTVSANSLVTAALAGPYQAEALRPRVFGRFADLLLAAEAHPAMLSYLDQAQSVGPNSLLARRNGRRAGLNENLAREILELHTVGARAGYSQSDVTEFAKALTGVSFQRLTDEHAPGRPVYRRAAHEPGTRRVMGVDYPQSGQEQARAILADLAAKPQTASFVCHKIARHFVADDPPPSLVERLARAWRETEGDLAQVALALTTAPEAWEGEPRKFKTPYEFMVSAWRAADEAPSEPRQLALLTAMGQKPFSPPSPEGWSDASADWATPDGMIKRLIWTEAFAPRAIGGRDPQALAKAVLGPRLGETTTNAVARAESRAEAFALLLMSPEFQRR